MNFKRGTRKKRLDVHICELPKTSKSNLPKLPPNAIFFSRWKRNFQKLFLVSVYHPLTRLYLRSRSAIAYEKRRHGRSAFWWVVHPHSDLRYYWDLIMSFTFLYMFVAVPYIFSFQRVAKSSGPESWEPIYPACIICIFDIALNFITGISSRDSSEIFLDPLLIIRRYVKGFFIIDFVSSVPYTWFYRNRISPPGHNGNSILLIPEFFLLLKICRICTLRLYVKHIIVDFSFSHAQEKTIWLALLMVLIFHWCSCATHVFPLIIAHLTGDTKEDSDMYFITTGLHKKSNLKIYLMYLHLGMSNFFGSSFIEFRSLGKMDTVIRCILLLLGKGCMIYILVIVLQLVKSAAEPELKYQQIMHSVKEYIADKKLPKKLRDRLIQYYEYRFQGSYFKEKAISNTLSNHLNQEIMVHSSRGLLDTATILHYLPRHVTGNLMGILKPIIYLNGDIIYKSESEGDCMFFVVSGTVALITYNGTEVCHEKDGGHFGEGALIFPDRRRAESAIALEVCELLHLKRQDFKRMFSLTSIFYKRLENVAKERQEQINKLNDYRGQEEKVAESILNHLPQGNLEHIDEKGEAGSQAPINYSNKNNNSNKNNDNSNKIKKSDNKEN